MSLESKILALALSDNPNPDAFIETLSPPLRGEMKLALYRDMLMKMPYLKRMDRIIAERLVSSMRSQAYMRGYWVVIVEEVEVG